MCEAPFNVTLLLCQSELDRRPPLAVSAYHPASVVEACRSVHDVISETLLNSLHLIDRGLDFSCSKQDRGARPGPAWTVEDRSVAQVTCHY